VGRTKGKGKGFGHRNYLLGTIEEWGGERAKRRDKTGSFGAN